jgi:hypothetical protein
MYVRADTAAARVGSFAPVRLLKRSRGHSVRNVSFTERVSGDLLFQDEDSPNSPVQVLLFR